VKCDVFVTFWRSPLFIIGDFFYGNIYTSSDKKFFGHFCNREIHIEKSCRFLYNVGKEG